MQRKWLWVAVSLAAVQVVLLGLVAATALGGRPVPLNPAVAIPIGVRAKTLAVTPDGGRVLVAGAGSQVRFIDTATNTVLGTLRTDQAYDVLVAPDGRTAYLLGTTELSVLDLTTDVVTSSVRLSGPAATASRLVGVTPDGRRLVAVPAGGGQIAAIDVSSGSSVPLLTVAPGTRLPVVNADVSRLYVPSDDYSKPGPVRVVDIATAAVHEVPDSDGIGELATSPDGRTVYGFGLDGTLVIDTATDTVTERLGGRGPLQPTVAAHDGAHVLAFDGSDGLLVRTLDNRTVAGAATQGYQDDFALSPDGTRLYALVDDSLLVFDVSAYA